MSTSLRQVRWPLRIVLISRIDRDAVFEPIVVRRAQLGGWTCRFNTSFLSFTRDASGTITSTVIDDLTKHEYKIRSKYLFGCDGARSQVLRELGIPLVKKPGQGLAINVLIKADLSAHVEHRNGNLHWLFQPEKDHPDFGWSCLVRMVKPWTEFVVLSTYVGMLMLTPYPIDGCSSFSLGSERA